MKFIKSISYYSFLLAVTFFVGKSAFSQIEFIENKGQWDKEVKFMSAAGNGAFFLQNKGFTVVQHNQADLDKMIDKIHGHATALKNVIEQKSVRSHAYKVEFVNANPNAEIIPDKAIQSINNYFIGNDKTKWVTDCRIFKGVTYKNVYPDIDVRFYSDATSGLKYDFIVHPGGNINKIALKYKGTDGLMVKNKELIIKTSLGENKELYPYTYEVVDNRRKELDAKYVVDGDIVKFKVNDHTPGTGIVIDPTLRFFTYSGSTADNWGFTATYGPDGSFYGGGISFGTGFPVSPGAFQTSYKGGEFDISIIKLSPNGRNRMYATYIGGGDQEQPHSLFVDPQGNLVIAGRSKSSDYPKTSALGAGGDWDIVVTKLSAAGNAIIGSMKIGGTGSDGVNIKDKSKVGTQSLNRNYGDDARSEVILDGAGNIYVASSTQSTTSNIASNNFPTTPGVFQPNPVGSTVPSKNQDAVVLKLSPNCNIIWSTYLAGSDNDAAYVLALSSNNNLYVAGGTESDNLKGISTNALSAVYNKGIDGFIIQLTADGTNATSGTYLGTVEADQVYGIQTDKAGNVYVMGTTEGNWTVQNASIFGAPNSKQFVAKLKPDLSSYIYSTTFGSGSAFPNISPTAFLVDRCENVYVSGWGGKANTIEGYSTGTTTGMPVTTTGNPIKTQTDASGSDFYFIVIKKDASSQLFGGFFGQNDPVGNSNPQTFGDHVDGGTSRFDSYGVIYQALCANCNKSVPFPGTPATWSETNQAQSGGLCNLGMLKIDMEFAGVVAGPKASISGVPYDTSGCIPLKVDFTDTIQNAKRYVWDFGDGSPKVTTTSANISHTYTTVGTFLVSLVAIDSTTCNIADTAYLRIKAGDNVAKLGFVPQKTGLCTDLSYIFTNTSTATRGVFSSNSFMWDFGDGSPRITTGPSPVTHTYAGPGTYIVKLILSDTAFCNSPDSVKKTVRLSPIVKAQFVTPAEGCVPYNAVFNNTSAGGLSFFWDFGDGQTSTDDNPTHLYTAVGKYTVKLYAFDSSSCNKIDSTQFTISVLPLPIAAFSYTPDPPKENTFFQFNNQSVGAIKYLWRFGDGDSSTLANPRHLFNATDTYNVCLIATNSAGCSDTTCIDVDAIILPLLDVPSAFTPDKFGTNSIVRVQGFGIKELSWKIYNRWGEKVFETTTQAIGWNGYYKGKLQQMDVYTYTLDALFSDGKKIRKTGDITLIR